ncbi:MAG: helix-turn-helix domain-containing protein [Acetobacteraceae bacterium]|nr:helix-turn-helix domain-containing protein [Acetobacteraceae bacterium]
MTDRLIEAADSCGFLTPPEAAARLRVSRSTLDRARADGSGPPFVRVGRRRILYPEAELRRWAANAASESRP